MTEPCLRPLISRPGGLTVLPTVSPVSVSVREGPAAHAFLTTHWAGLYEKDRNATPYQSPQWQAAHAERLPVTADLMVLVAEDPTGPRAAFAVVRSHRAAGWKELQPLSAPSAEYARIIGPDAEHPAVAAAMAEALTRLGGHVMLPDVPANSALGRYISQWQHAVTRCARIDLPVGYRSLPRPLRRTHKRQTRAWDLVARGHQVAYRRTTNLAELRAAYTTLARLHQLRWAGPRTSHRPTAADEHLRSVLEHCAQLAFIATLTLDNTPVAAQLCVHRGRQVYALLPATDPAHTDLQPGAALLRHLTDDLAAAGCTTLDLGRTSCAPGQDAVTRQYAPTWTATLTAARRMTTPDEGIA